MKQCSKCGTCSSTAKHGTVCQPCKNARQREYRKKTNNMQTRLYERFSKKGFLMRVYRNMLSRVKGTSIRGRSRYAGKSILNRQEFYQWALSDPGFNRLFANWLKSGGERKQAPSIDRIDAKEGYLLTNIRWLTLSENSRLGGMSK